jgi:hypothetical protein
MYCSLQIILPQNVNWEARRREAKPKWYRCGLRAEELLQRSNPAFQFVKPHNIQCTGARTQLAALWAQAVVFSDCFYPLNLEVKKCSWSWLMQGGERAQRKITGMNGLCPKLIHLIAKTTFLASRLFKVGLFSSKCAHLHSRHHPHQG